MDYSSDDLLPPRRNKGEGEPEKGISRPDIDETRDEIPLVIYMKGGVVELTRKEGLNILCQIANGLSSIEGITDMFKGAVNG